MKQARWSRIEVIFHDALSKNAVERPTYLEQVCGEDLDLLSELRTLLASYEQPAEILEENLVTAGLALLALKDEEALIGQTLDHYFLEKRIGRGGMGSVYLANDMRLDRKVAVKLLPTSLVDNPSSISRLEREARAASRIAHPNIGHIYEYGESGGRHYIAMEYIEGVTLRERLREKSLNVKEAINLVVQVGRALIVAHSNGVLHRDIKPDNLMVHREGYVKVLDFGIAKSTDVDHNLDNGESFETEAGLIVGSPAYMSPEQARGLSVDQRTDLWSLGIVVYEALSGRNPFLAETRTDTLAAILKLDPVPIEELCPALPGRLAEIISRLLSKDRNDRYPNAQSLINDLEAFTESSNSGQSTRISSTVAVRPNGRSSSTTSRNLQRLSDQSHSGNSRVWLTLTGMAKLTWLRIAVVLAMVVVGFAIVSPGRFINRRTNTPKLLSIAVLPLVNRSGDASTDYLGLGVSESLIERFGRLPSLKVIARESSFKYENTDEVKAIAQKLDVQGVIRGAITIERGQREINLELVDAASNSKLWTGQYTYEIDKLPGTIDEICLAIGEKLNATKDELSLITKQQSSSGSAYDYYLKGKIAWSLLSEDSVDKSIGYFNEAVRIDPGYARAYAGLANSYVTMGANYRSPSDEFAKAQQAAQRALAIDNNLAEAHYAIAVTKFLSWEFASAEAESKRALELNSNYALANSLLCSLSLTKGDTKQAYVYIKRALELDPLSLLFNTHLAYVFYCLHENDQALKQFQDLFLIEPSASFAYNDIARVYAQQGKYSEALAASQRATVLLGQDPNTLTSLGIVYALAGKTKEARWVAGTLENLTQTKHVQPYLIASIYSAMGNKDLAFTWLIKANAERSPQMLRLRVDPVFDKLRKDSRYDQLLKVTGFI
jgi:serine/threonine protein kinase/Tfp pilus assembly protein PilF